MGRSDPLTSPELLITAPRVIPATAGRGILEPGYVAARSSVVTAVAPGPSPHGPDIELPVGMLLPGFVDLQVNGYFVVEFMTAGAAAGLSPGDGEPRCAPTAPWPARSLRMDGAAANMMTAGTGPTDAVAAATRLPADLIGWPDLGRIAPPAAADLAWLDDDMRTRATWIGGELVYSRTGDSEAGTGKRAAVVTDGGSPGGRAG